MCLCLCLAKSSCHFLLVIWGCQLLGLDGWSTWSWFFAQGERKGPCLFCKTISSFPNSISWKDYSFLTFWCLPFFCCCFLRWFFVCLFLFSCQEKVRYKYLSQFGNFCSVPLMRLSLLITALFCWPLPCITSWSVILWCFKLCSNYLRLL